MIKEIKEIVEYALYKIDSYSDDALAMVVRTGMAESGYRALKGYGDGNPAIGFFQIEPATLHDMIDNYIKYRSHYEIALIDLGMKLNKEDLLISVKSNIAVQAALCRLHYRRDRHAIPSWDDLESQGKYWKRVYNTNEGRGTVKHFIEVNEKIEFD
tara:strand:+ start:1390 stop:1857 length:468 start_codon:yes stop_codon:yes gene_type:complete